MVDRLLYSPNRVVTLWGSDFQSKEILTMHGPLFTLGSGDLSYAQACVRTYQIPMLAQSAKPNMHVHSRCEEAGPIALSQCSARFGFGLMIGCLQHLRAILVSGSQTDREAYVLFRASLPFPVAISALSRILASWPS